MRHTAGVIATTSQFTRGAREFREQVPFIMSLRDFEAMKDWLVSATGQRVKKELRE
jgi:hypothetical protein